jgi:Flp pilus assembly protein TadG
MLPISRRRRGVALVYLAIIMVAMMALASLGVDLGRYEMVQAQIYNAAMAAARAGANDKAGGGTSTTTPATALAVATDNQVDGQQITSGMVTVSYGNWSGTTFTSYTSGNYSNVNCNAVQVKISYNVPLVFAQVLGLANKTATKTSVATESVSVDTPYVYATGNPWLAGEPTGTQASQPDARYGKAGHLYKYDYAGTAGKDTHGTAVTSTSYNSYEPYASPVQVAFTVTPGSRITLTNTSGSASQDYLTAAYSDATGNTGTTNVEDDASANGVSEHGISDAFMPVCSMAGVFLSNSVPDSGTVPAVLNFSTQASRDYINLSPALQQVFYVGSGTTSGGTQQSILVPPNATRFFLGAMDGHEWNNNVGGFNTTVTQTTITTVQ